MGAKSTDRAYFRAPLTPEEARQLAHTTRIWIVGALMAKGWELADIEVVPHPRFDAIAVASLAYKPTDHEAHATTIRFDPPRFVGELIPWLRKLQEPRR